MKLMRVPIVIATMFCVSASVWAQGKDSAELAEHLHRKAQIATESGSNAQALESLDAALSAGLSTSAVLTDPQLIRLHELRPFREMIKKHTHDNRVDYVPADEPGTRLRVTGRVLDQDGNPIPGALVYVFQTNTEGIYSSAGGNATIGDSLNPRLFGYVRADAQGKYTYDTIRPGEYRGGGPPAHIHYEVTADDFMTRTTEIMFRDDPRVEGRSGESADGAIIFVDVEKEADGSAHCSADIVLKLQV